MGDRPSPLRPVATRGRHEELRLVEHVVRKVRLKWFLAAVIAALLGVLILHALHHPSREHLAAHHMPMARAFCLRFSSGRLLGWGIGGLADGSPGPFLTPPPPFASLRYNLNVTCRVRGEAFTATAVAFRIAPLNGDMFVITGASTTRHVKAPGLQVHIRESALKLFLQNLECTFFAALLFFFFHSND